ncbi:hypothetical protein M9H77_17618 [Catharanthus roseus]|uniref:Uncharacterized protein n=1 Tax=Catharanthus roseus TaxID=4058 RepID=A0ACC0B537_CATRO|nr:hypothetical protein M9H77_17618 [Catharanthus roseus]
MIYFNKSVSGGFKEDCNVVKPFSVVQYPDTALEKSRSADPQGHAHDIGSTAREPPRSIIETFHESLNGEYPCWGQVPDAVKEIWWIEFMCRRASVGTLSTSAPHSSEGGFHSPSRQEPPWILEDMQKTLQLLEDKEV